LGARISVLGNWVDEASQDKYDEERTRKPPTYFSSWAAFGHIGYN